MHPFVWLTFLRPDASLLELGMGQLVDRWIGFPIGGMHQSFRVGRPEVVWTQIGKAKSIHR